MGSPKKKHIKDEKVLAEKQRLEDEKKKETSKPQRVEKKELQIIVRVANTDLDGEKPLIRAIRGIKGISYSMSKVICYVSGFDPYMKLGSLNEADLQKLEQIINEPDKFNVPEFLLNRRKDIETGKNIHLTGSDLAVARKFDVQRYVDLKTYRGWRHMLGQPVRGQRTRSHFRQGRVVGVLRKAVKMQMQKAGTTTEEKKEEKKKVSE